MEIKEVMQAFREDKPVRYGDMVFERIEGVLFKNARYNQYVADSAVKTGCVRRLVQKFLKIVQTLCVDKSGTEYWLNPKRLDFADPGEVNVPVGVDRVLQNRMKLLDVFNVWCKEESLPPNPESLILFLFAEDLINAAKAYNIVKSFENSSTTP